MFYFITLVVLDRNAFRIIVMIIVFFYITVYVDFIIHLLKNVHINFVRYTASIVNIYFILHYF